MPLTILKNIALDDTATSERTATVGEPTVAATGARLFVTGNWFASRSTNGGASWTLIDPFTELPAAAGGFCCDQIVLYSRAHRIWIWILQYIEQGGSNVLRVAASRTGAPGSWHWWDFSATGLNPAWRNLWFDYPDLAESTGNLWLTTNVFDTSDAWKRAVVLKFPLASIASGGRLSYRFWSTTQHGSLRLVQGAGESMNWGAQNGTSGLRVSQWTDSGTTVTHWDVAVSPWSNGPYSSEGPGGVEWLSRCDDRITGAWVAKDRLGFMWTASPRAKRPHPYIRVVRLDEPTKTLVDEPDIWSQNGAWAYPSAAPNSLGQTGFTAFFGGGTRHPCHVVGVRDDTAATWQTTITQASTHGPADPKWGDYLACRRHPTRRTSWIASGYTLQGGNARKNVEPRVVQFSM